MISNKKILDIIKDLQEKRQYSAARSREDNAYGFCIRKLKALVDPKNPQYEVIPLQIKKRYRDFKKERENELIREDF
jgi:hypothetical protein